MSQIIPLVILDTIDSTIHLYYSLAITFQNKKYVCKSHIARIIYNLKSWYQYSKSKCHTELLSLLNQYPLIVLQFLIIPKILCSLRFYIGIFIMGYYIHQINNQKLILRLFKCLNAQKYLCQLLLRHSIFQFSSWVSKNG